MFLALLNPVLNRPLLVVVHEWLERRKPPSTPGLSAFPPALEASGPVEGDANGLPIPTNHLHAAGALVEAGTLRM